MKKKTKSAALVALTVLVVACEKYERSNPEQEPLQTEVKTEEQSLTQHYIFENKQYDVELIYDENFNVIRAEGDALLLAETFRKKNIHPSALLVEDFNYDLKECTIRVFEDEVEMNAYDKENEVPQMALEKNCTDYTSANGTAFFRFYEHDNFVNELGILSMNNQSYFQRQYFSWENDKISSLKIWGTTTGASVDIFEHSCFYGKTTRFRIQTAGQVYAVPSLSLVSFDYCIDVWRDVYGMYYQSLPYPCGNWNDKISSIKGWSI